nr:hypothetical protein [Tanacetum cinerariifolium]
MKTQKHLLKDKDGEEVDVHIYRLMIGSLMYLTYSRPDIMFATTAKSKTINGEVQIHALAYGMKVYLNIFGQQLDGLPTHKEKYVVSFHTKKVFVNMKRIGKGFFGKETPLFPTMVGPNQVQMDKAVHKEMGDSLVRATTTTSSLKAEQDSGNIAKTQTKATSNELSSQKTISGDGPRHQDTMRDTFAHTRLISSSDDEALDKEDISKQGRIDEIDVDEDIALVSTHDDVSSQDNIVQDEFIEDVGEEEVVEVVTTAKIIIDAVIDDVQVTTAITDIPVSAADIIVTTALTITAKSTKTNVEKRRKLFAVKRNEEKRNKPPTKAQQRSLMCNYSKNMDGWKPKALKNKSFAKIQELFDKAMKRINNFIDFRTELVEESLKKVKAETTQESGSKKEADKLEQERSKKQKFEDDKESEELKKCLEIIPDNRDDITIDATPLSSKSPTIVDYKIYKERKKNYFHIFRADGNSQMYLTFSKLLKNYDREDLKVLCRLVKDKASGSHR